MEKNQNDWNQVVIVGIGDHAVGPGPMSSIGLGSCVGLVIHDSEKCIGGLAHVMLPDSGGRTERPGKFADTAIDALVSILVGQGCRKTALVAKMVGGAAMFKTLSENLNIGERNITAIKENLKQKNIPIKAECVGGSVGRTLTYYPSDGGKVVIKLADGKKNEI
ncbi:MAG: chemotaxis protein CheD [Methanoregulaceae archaeon]|nr:chemotaxis protein CheD [Methanoregulaceae archaeon]